MKPLKILALALLACSLMLVSCKKPKQYTITVTVNDASMGTATGGGTYDEKTTATLTATANNNFRFVKWDDGNTDNPRTVTVTGDATYMAVFAYAGEEPTEDGVFVTIGANSWKAHVFQVDDQSMPGKIRLWLYQSVDADYPQIQGWMNVNATGTVDAALLYMANENDVDNMGYPNWESKDMTTTIASFNAGTHTITADQTGKMYNRTTAEELFMHISYHNAVWEATPTPSKQWALK